MALIERQVKMILFGGPYCGYVLLPKTSEYTSVLSDASVLPMDSVISYQVDNDTEVVAVRGYAGTAAYYRSLNTSWRFRKGTHTPLK